MNISEVLDEISAHCWKNGDVIESITAPREFIKQINDYFGVTMTSIGSISSKHSINIIETSFGQITILVGNDFSVKTRKEANTNARGK